jgi:hypothetical protein
MTSIVKTGHAKNVANFQILIAFVIQYGSLYNPFNKDINLDQLNALATEAQNSLSDVIVKNTAYHNAVNERVHAHKKLKLLFTRLINAFLITEASSEKKTIAKALNRKMLGKKPISSKTKKNPNLALPKNSISQQSYHQQLLHLSNLIALLQSEPSYNLNESEFKIGSVLAFQKTLIEKNANVITTNTQLSNARIARNTILYDTDTGLVRIATLVKKYIIGLYGFTSPQYAQIKGIAFMKEKK